MKDLEYYLHLNDRLEIQKDDEGGYVMSFPELPGCVSCAETKEDAVRIAEEAKKEWMMAAMEEQIEIPEPKRVEQCPNSFKLRLPKSLYFDLSHSAKREGVSMNQYCLYLLSQNRG